MTWTFLLSQGFAVTAGPELPDPGKAPMSRQQQIQLGFQAAAQVYQQMPVLPDNSPETQYIRKLGQKLAATDPGAIFVALRVSCHPAEGDQRLRPAGRSHVRECRHDHCGVE